MLQQNNIPHTCRSITPNSTQSPIQSVQSLHLARSNQAKKQQNGQTVSFRLKSVKKHTQDEGFALEQQEEQEVVIVKKEQALNSTVSTNSRRFISYKIKQPRIKLTFLSKQRNNQQPLSATLKKQYDNKSLQMKRTSHSKALIPSTQSSLPMECLIKLKRNFIADNIVYQNYSSDENKKIKCQIFSAGNKVVYEIHREGTTYAQLSLLRDKGLKSGSRSSNLLGYPDVITQCEKMSSSCGLIIKQTQAFFLDSPINRLLKTRLKDSFIHHRRKQSHKQNKQIEFDAQFQSGNLQIVAKVQHNHKQYHSSKTAFTTLQYNLYLRGDTNTHGHQNWFYFRMKSNLKEKKRVKLNLVNLKRGLNLVKEGQKIYIRTINPTKSQWMIGGENIELKENKSTNVYKCKVRTLSFQIQVQAETEYQVSLLPPYTYSQMLVDIEPLKQCKHAKVQTLTYSLVGLAIPIITFTNFDSEDSNKEVILVSARIHPGETVASFIVKGLIQALANSRESTEIEQFLNCTIVKVIPILNPDGVVFGNFRTNYLGYDLNRSFHTEDEITNPEVKALKQLGRKLKNQHGDKFNTFIDLHGHSGEKNIFTYGPDFENGHERFYKARLLPKILNSKSPYFKYSSCNFKLQQYKVNTARAFFLNQLNVTAFTIESSYALYETAEGKTQLLTQKQWLSFGNSLCQSFSLISRLSKTHTIKNRTQLKRVVSFSEQENNRLLAALKKEMKKQEAIARRKKPSPPQLQKQPQDSDGEDQMQDLDPAQRDQMQKRLTQNATRNYVLPKVFKPSILYPTVTPKLYNIGESDLSNYKVLYARRNRYHSIKIPANNYLHSLQGVDSLKPKARNIKLERKIQY